MRTFSIILLLCFGFLSPFSRAAEKAAAPAEPSKEGVEFFEKNIRPVLAERCYKCHSEKSEKLKGKLLLDSREGVLKGGENGPVVISGDPEKSSLVVSLRWSDPDLQMPPKEQLSKEQVAAFATWVKMGAPDPRSGTSPAAAKRDAYDWAEQKQFWSFKPVTEPAVPGVKDAALSNLVDRFLQAAYEAKGLHPAQPADKRTLIRRVTYDLTGLPPTPQEVDAFLADGSPGAFEKVVDRLLASPAYGEAWGRHWLDVVRYADTAGCNSDFPVPQAYKYRDYVIDAFNKDKPFDQFLREQLAGDLLPAKDDAEKREHVIATGYLANARRFGSSGKEFHLTIEDTIDNVGKSMLGLSVSCARCHDHKFDPIPNSDYYALYGIFGSTTYAFPGTELFKHPRDLVPLSSGEEAAQVKEYDATVAKLDHRFDELKNEKLKLSSRLKAESGKAASPEQVKAVAKIQSSLDKAKAEAAEIQDELKRLEGKAPAVEKAYAVSEGSAPTRRSSARAIRATWANVVPRGFLTVLGGRKLPAGEKGSGRLELAGWVASADNPLTARVMANRIWQHHFGAGLVKTPNDFGHRGQPPTNPALLDYLASRFVKSGWSVKSMHRLIVLSRAYRMADQIEDAGDSVAASNQSIDPANDLLWRFNPRRLSAEEIRDTVLVLGGSLDRARPARTRSRRRRSGSTRSTARSWPTTPAATAAST